MAIGAITTQGWVLIAALVLGGLIILLSLIAPKSAPPPPVPVPPPPPSPPPPTGITRGVVYRHTSLVTDAEVASYLTAQQAQLDGAFATAYGPAQIIAATPGYVLQASDWPVYLLDVSDVAGALAYHDIDPSGRPYANVFVQTCINAGVSWQSACSHEVLEVIPDPATTRTAIGPNGRPWAYETCLDGSTEIALLDGTNVPIKNLVDREYVWVYSLNLYGKVAAGRAHAIRKAKEDAELLDVRLDSGQAIRCTPDHLFLLRDGSYCRADSLVAGISLMPLYRRLKTYDQLPPYEQVYQPTSGGWAWTHHIAVECPKGSHRHHRDLNRLNNSPENLAIVSNAEHSAIHGALPPSAAKLRANRLHFLALNASHRGQSRPELRVPKNVSPEDRAASAIRGAAALRAYNQSDAHRAAARVLGPSAMERNIRSNPEVLGRLRVIHTARVGAINHFRWHEQRGLRSSACVFCADAPPLNHAVVAVSPAGRGDVYDLSVEQYHNFGLAAGVFVHNCDPCEAQFDPSSKGLSDYVFPSWFDVDGTAPYDAAGILVAPFTVASGGYAQFMDVSGHWDTIQGYLATGTNRL